MGRGWEILSWAMGPRSSHAEGLKMASISSGAPGKARCFLSCNRWFLLNKGWLWMVHVRSLFFFF